MRLNPGADLFTKVFNQEFFNTGKLPPNINEEIIINALIESACHCFGMEIEIKPLSPDEWEEIIRTYPRYD
jgi:lipoate-protein ligase A